jgi:hypothetical protein
MTLAQWAWVISVVLGIALAFLTARLDSDKKMLAGLLGLAVVCIGGTVALYFELGAVQAEQATVLSRAIPTIRSNTWNSVVKEIADYDRSEPENQFEEILDDPLRESISRTFYEARDGNIDLTDKNEVVLITDKLLDKAQQSVLATSYINPGDWWSSDIAPTYNAKLQETKRRVSKFRRIFIVGSNQEAQTLVPVMRAQESDGVAVRFVCAGSISPDRREDFIVIDSSIAAELKLDTKREFKSATFYSTSIRSQDFEKRFEILWVAGKPPSEIAGARCTVVTPY